MKLTFREGGPRGDGLLEPQTSHLPTLALGTWSRLSPAGTGPSWPSDPRPGPEAACISLSSSSCRLPWPPSPFLNLGVPLRGQDGWQGPRGDSSSAWGTLLLGTPVIQGHPGAREPGQPPRKRARRDSPPPLPGPGSPAPAQARSGPRAGRSRGCTCSAAGPSVQHREAGRSEGPSGRPGWAAAPKEQARAGVAASLSCLITYTYSF